MLHREFKESFDNFDRIKLRKLKEKNLDIHLNIEFLKALKKKTNKLSRIHYYSLKTELNIIIFILSLITIIIIILMIFNI